MNISKKWIGLFLAGLMVVAMMPATVMAEENDTPVMKGNVRMLGAGVAQVDEKRPMMGDKVACEELDFETVQERLLNSIDNHIVKIEESENLDDEEKKDLIALLEETKISIEEAESTEELREIMGELAEELRDRGYHPLRDAAKNHPRFAWKCVDFENAQEHVVNFIDNIIERLTNAENLDEEIVEEYTDKFEEITDSVEEAEDKEELREVMKEIREILKELRDDIRDNTDEE